MSDILPEIVLVKLGGSLITDKSRPATDRPEVIVRLAGEIAEIAARGEVRLVVGHGSGSFGHVAAMRSGIHRGAASEEELAGVSETQAQAAELHHRVIAALTAAGGRPFSFAPSSAALFAAGRPAEFHAEPLLRALEIGLLPVTYGDVILDVELGSAICSTEVLFEMVAGLLRERGLAIRGALWLGVTDGIYDAGGSTVPRVTRENLESVLAAAGASAGTDVTGGMRLRLESALRLAALRVPSLIVDGRPEGSLASALRALQEDASAPGTRVHGGHSTQSGS